MENAVVYENISMHYGKKTVFENLNLTIEKGSFVTVIGSSGCGKTTLLKMVNGLIRPGGNIYVFGENINNLNLINLRRNIGYVVQGNALFPHMTVLENIAYVPRLLNKKDKEKTQNAIKKWMDIVGLDEELMQRYPSELSGGQQQRVGIARALAASPDLLLMDEPFASVDEITRTQLQTELASIHQKTGITVMFVTHDIGEALRMATKVLVLEDGKIAAYAAPDELLQNPATPFVEKLMEKARFSGCAPSF